jgi:quercetin dioxygenase-like cupin family protein
MASTPGKPTYDVKSVETIVAGSDVHARLYTLAPGDVIPWHFHSQVTDWYFCLAGKLAVETRAPDEHRIIDVGAGYPIRPETAHRISNGGETDCRFLLLQGVGQYDFNRI